MGSTIQPAVGRKTEERPEQRPCGCVARWVGEGPESGRVVKGRQGPVVGEMGAKDRKTFKVCVWAAGVPLSPACRSHPCQVETGPILGTDPD